MTFTRSRKRPSWRKWYTSSRGRVFWIMPSKRMHESLIVV